MRRDASLQGAFITSSAHQTPTYGTIFSPDAVEYRHRLGMPSG